MTTLILPAAAWAIIAEQSWQKLKYSFQFVFNESDLKEKILQSKKL